MEVTNKTTKMLRIAAWLLVAGALFLFAVVALPHKAYAEELIDTSRSCTLTESYDDAKGTALSGISARLYRVADYASDGQLSLSEDFSASGADFSQVLDASSSLSLAASLAGYAESYDVVPAATTLSDEQGKARFTGLVCGVYLFVSSNYRTDDREYLFTPVLISLPQIDSSVSPPSLSYEVTARAKYTVRPITQESRSYAVVKHWSGDSAESRPTSVRIDILKDGVSQGIHTLDSSNNWSFEWDAPDDGSLWRVAELDVPAGYTPTIRTIEDGTAKTYFVLTNTQESNEEPPPPSEVPKSGLPQMGDSIFWLASSLLALVGIACLIAAIARFRLHDGE